MKRKSTYYLFFKSGRRQQKRFREAFSETPSAQPSREEEPIKLRQVSVAEEAVTMVPIAPTTATSP